jgi:integrase
LTRLWSKTTEVGLELDAGPCLTDPRTRRQQAPADAVLESPARARRERKRQASATRKLADNLLVVFGQGGIDAITPQHVRQYLDVRGETAKVRANREKALLSHFINKAREWGYSNAANPCAGVRGFKETGRDVYVTDEAFMAVYAAAHPTLQDAMDIAYLTGQRRADVRKIKRSDIRDGHLHIVQNKTGAHLRIAIEGERAASWSASTVVPNR